MATESQKPGTSTPEQAVDAPTEIRAKSMSNTELNPNEEHTLLASPAEWEGHRTEGAALDVCSVCKTEVTLAPTSQLAQVEYKVRILCIPCGLEELKASDEKPEFRALPGQVEEIAGELHRLDGEE
jgi:hypothetical protein